MSASYTTVREYGKHEYEDRKSVFIGECLPVSSEKEALSFIDSVKRRYPDARHHVYAYVLRENSTTRFTDDHEPQGTAGMPVLDTIRKNGCTDTVIVVTRYFGGTLLGTGGLVHAYTEAAVGALRAAGVVTYDVYTETRITVSYSDYQKLSTLFADLDFRTDDTDYRDLVIISGRIKSSLKETLLERVTELTSGRAETEFFEDKFDC